jgi:hypothetical protein
VNNPQDVLKAPLVLGFLGLREQERFSESDLESAIITRIGQFLLELGKGFLFEARQKRFTTAARPGRVMALSAQATLDLPGAGRSPFPPREEVAFRVDQALGTSPEDDGEPGGWLAASGEGGNELYIAISLLP